MLTEAANPKNYRIAAQFYVDPTHGPVCERKLGPGAGDDTVIERITAEHIAAHPAEFARFQSSRASVAVIGTGLKRGLGMPDDLVRLLNTHGIMDVETLATIDDSRIVTLMPGNPELGMENRDRARLMIPEDRRTSLAAVAPIAGPASRQAAVEEIAELKAALARSEREKADALAMLVTATPSISDMLDELEDVAGEGEAEATIEGAARRGPGRPRRAQG